MCFFEGGSVCYQAPEVIMKRDDSPKVWICVDDFIINFIKKKNLIFCCLFFFSLG